MAASEKTIKKVEIRMYKMGTGDCFALKFYNKKDEVSFKMLIDAGAQRGPASRLKPYIKDLVGYFNGAIDVLIVTHEHQDHVLAFHACKTEFSKLKIKNIWLAWTEKDEDDNVKEWKKEYGKKKKALMLANEQLKKAIRSNGFKSSIANHIYENRLVSLKERFIESVETFQALHIDDGDTLAAADDKVYVGGLKGMKVVKNEMAQNNIKYLTQGEILDNIEGLTGMRIYILGPPNNWKEVKIEKGKGNEAYKHNKDLDFVRGFSSLFLSQSSEGEMINEIPFNEEFHDSDSYSTSSVYKNKGNSWRRIDFEWLNSAANLALRLNRGINNLSVVMAMEFVESKRVLLFPGDAEIGSWQSWHQIKWPGQKDDEKHLTEDLLNRTVFYKVAHHLSHNGTAKEQGLEMMNHKDLVAMATLDYDVISSTWTSTMPNRAILQSLLEKTRGRLIVMNPSKLFVDKKKRKSLSSEIKKNLKDLKSDEKTKFTTSLINKKENKYIQFTVEG